MIVLECLKKINDLERNNKVTLFWVSGHVGVEGNEQADTSTSTPLTGPESLCGIGNAYV